MLIVNHGWSALPIRRINTWWSRGFARALTFLCAALAWVLFRAADLDAASAIYNGLVAVPDIGDGGRLVESLAWLAFWMGIVWFWPNTQQWLAMVRPAFNYKWADRKADPLLLPVDGTKFQRLALWRPSGRVAIAVGLMAAASFLSLQRVSEFLYFQF